MYGLVAGGGVAGLSMTWLRLAEWVLLTVGTGEGMFGTAKGWAGCCPVEVCVAGDSSTNSVEGQVQTVNYVGDWVKGGPRVWQ